MTDPQHDDAPPEALQLLGEAISRVVERSETGWRLGSMADLDAGPALVDANGAVLQVLADIAQTGDREAGGGHDTVDREVIGALLAAYDYVLAAERRARAATDRARKAEREAYLDHLTELPNRRAWDQALVREQARCDRGDTTAAIAVVDVDNLKEVNDDGGHLAGDLLLRRTADVLRRAFRGGDVVARIGGDEFAVLVVDFRDDRPALLAERVQSVLDEVEVVASVGAAVHRPGQRLVDAWTVADQAMYAQKRTRKR